MREGTRRFQFRLRSLVAVVTAYSVWLGIQVGYASRREIAGEGVWGWLLVCVVWSLLAALVAWTGCRRGRSPLVWFIVALVLNPLVAWLGLVLANEMDASRQAARVQPARSTREHEKK